MPVCDNTPIDTVSILIGWAGKVKAREKIPGTVFHQVDKKGLLQNIKFCNKPFLQPDRRRFIFERWS